MCCIGLPSVFSISDLATLDRVLLALPQALSSLVGVAMKNTGSVAAKQILAAAVGKSVIDPSIADATDVNSPVILEHVSHAKCLFYRNAIVENMWRNALVAQKLLITLWARPDISLVNQYAKGMFFLL